MSGAPDGHGAVGVVLEVGLALAGAAIAVSASTGGLEEAPGLGQISIVERGLIRMRDTSRQRHCTPLRSHACS